MKFILILLLSLGAPLEAEAQTVAVPAPAAIRTLLESSDQKDQAWGAWWAGQSSIPEFQALLERNLANRVSGSTWQDEAVMDTSLDALIRTGAPDIPFSFIESVYSRRKQQALILLPQVKREPALDSFLIQLLHERSQDGLGKEWFVAANLLLERRIPGIAAAILTDMTIRGTVFVCDAGRPCDTATLGRMSIGDGSGWIIEGFPPWPNYDVQKVPDRPRNVTTFLPGPVSMGYSRYVSREGTRPPGLGSEARSQNPGSPSTNERLIYIKAAAPNLRMEIGSDETRTIVWQKKTVDDAAVESFRRDLNARYLRLIEQLRDAGLLSKEEFAPLAARAISITVEDRRAVKTPL